MVARVLITRSTGFVVQHVLRRQDIDDLEVARAIFVLTIANPEEHVSHMRGVVPAIRLGCMAAHVRRPDTNTERSSGSHYRRRGCSDRVRRRPGVRRDV